MNEQIIDVSLHKKNTQCIGLRFFTVYGEWGRPDMFMMQYLNATYDKSKLFYLNNYGNHLRDFTYIKDACKILKKLIYAKLKNKHSSIQLLVSAIRLEKNIYTFLGILVISRLVAPLERKHQ